MRIRFVVPFSRATANLIPVVVLTLTCAAQSIPVEYLFMPHRWDGAHGVVFFGKGLARKENRPIRAYIDGSPRGAPIDIFKDFPNLQKAVVDDFAAAPDGRTLVAVVLIFGARLRHVILTYDASGKLVSVLDTEPYYFQAIATDDNGNVFALGNKLNEGNERVEPYPLLVVYDATGHVVGAGLSSSVFKNASRAVNQNEDGVDPSLMVKDGKLFIYAPEENEILVCLPDGTVIRRRRMDDVLLKIQRTEGMTRVRPESVAFVDDNHVMVDVIGHSGPQKAREFDLARMHPAAYLLNLTTGKHKVILRGQMVGWNFLGVKGNQLLMLSAVGGQNSTMSHDFSED